MNTIQENKMVQIGPKDACMYPAVAKDALKIFGNFIIPKTAISSACAQAKAKPYNVVKKAVIKKIEIAELDASEKVCLILSIGFLPGLNSHTKNVMAKKTNKNEPTLICE